MAIYTSMYLVRTQQGRLTVAYRLFRWQCLVKNDNLNEGIPDHTCLSCLIRGSLVAAAVLG